MTVLIKNNVGLAIVDSEVYITIADTRVAQQYGLIVCTEVVGNFGKFGVPGSGVEHDYAGVVEDSFELRVSQLGLC